MNSGHFVYQSLDIFLGRSEWDKSLPIGRGKWALIYPKIEKDGSSGFN
jgi:hypothetical protein